MKKKKIASKLLSIFLAITMTLTLTPAVSAKATDKLETPTNVKLSKNETKINEDYSAGFKVSWTKVSGAAGSLDRAAPFLWAGGVCHKAYLKIQKREAIESNGKYRGELP